MHPRKWVSRWATCHGAATSEHSSSSSREQGQASRAAESSRSWPRVPGSELPVCKGMQDCSGAGSGARQWCMWVGSPSMNGARGPDQALPHPRLTKPPAQTFLHLGLGEHQGQGLPVSRPVAPPRALSILRKKKCGLPTTPDTPVGNQSPQSQPSSHSPRLGGQRGSKGSPPQTQALSLSPLWGSLLLFPSCERQPSPGPPLGHPSRPLVRDAVGRCAPGAQAPRAGSVSQAAGTVAAKTEHLPRRHLLMSLPPGFPEPLLCF